MLEEGATVGLLQDFTEKAAAAVVVGCDVGSLYAGTNLI